MREDVGQQLCGTCLLGAKDGDGPLDGHFAKPFLAFYQASFLRARFRSVWQPSLDR